MATESSREARRKRILDRGSDRLAFISGQARSLPPSAVSTPPPPPPHKLGGGGGEVEEPLPVAVDPARDDAATGYELPKCEPSSASVRDTIDRSTGIETFPQREKSNEAVAAMQDKNGQIEPVTVRGSHNQVVNNEPRQAKGQIYEIFTAKRISSSISASENIRMLCATFIALLVVLSYHGYPLGIESIISFRPIVLIFLTDATIVVGVLFTTKWEEKDEKADAGTTAQESKDWTDQIGKVLEAALASQKAATALFLDFSLCAVIIICGTSFIQKT